MEGADLLPTLAEIAVAFAGFASLVSILGGRSSGDQLVANLVRLRGMLQSAIVVLAFSFAPFLPAKFGASAEVSWRTAGAVYALAMLAPIPFQYPRILSSPVNSRVAVSIGLMQIVAGLALAASVATLSSNVVVGAYHFALFVGLATSSVLFMRVVTSAYSVETPPA
ncbi:MAG: hypothetical protein AMS21_11305 [Gemmatimonas sp. SG8_38_2]|jgi:hypothetical protein|nr:MAG: hypothetical protein AMS21_11305 [Gemmatimonas sp. SG8_38_2]